MSTAATAADDAESVDQFLARIASLKDRKDREDEDRIRKMEEDILQGREERKARRAERARSISPSKSSPAPSSNATMESRSIANRSIDPPVELTPSSQTQTPTRDLRLDASQSPRFSGELTDIPATRALPTPPKKNLSTPAPTPPTATSLSRSGTLSWQQRPTSRDSNAFGPRPLSRSPAPTQAPVNTNVSQTEPEEEISRDQIARSLGSKDPAFFRQTADRGVASAAYRRNESDRDSERSTTRSMRLPGMAQDYSRNIRMSPGLDGEFAKPEKLAYDAGSLNLKTVDDSTAPIFTSTVASSHTSPLPTPKLVPTTTVATSVATETKSMDEPAMAFPGWGSSRRSPSPTKGLGGFVESAMMKRSDSVSKRWSVQAAPGLKRGDSVASHRGAAGGGGFSTQFSSSGSPPRQTKPIRPLSSSSPVGSRPTSSHDLSASLSKPACSSETFSLDKTPDASEEQPKSIRLDIGQSQDNRPNTRVDSSEHVNDHPLPVGPTKTMDSRRWSPTKSSWLESALSRPDSSKTISSKPDEPAWKINMHKAKSSVTNLPAANFEVNTTGLLRSPPIGGHSKQWSISGLPESFSSGMVKKSPEKSRSAVTLEDPKTKVIEPELVSTTDMINKPPPKSVLETRSVDTPFEKPLGDAEPFVSSPPFTAKRDPPPVKAKPATPPKTDFRSTLKSRQAASSGDSTAEPEFKAVFGKLKRTETKNFVAPDELKDNISRGKAALNLTGGPQKTKRVDEFKESILQKKEAMKEGTGLIVKPTMREKPAAIVPEALAKKEAIKSGTGPLVKPSVSEKPEVEVPEAPAKRQLLGKTSSTISDPRAMPVRPETPPAKPLNIKRQTDPVQIATKPSLEADAEDWPLPREQPAQHLASPPKQEFTNSKLASRLNPALAGLLSRGASPKPSNNNSPAASTEDLSAVPQGFSRKPTKESTTVEGPALTHMTKARAKGPKRRTPKADAPSEAAFKNPPPEDKFEAAPIIMHATERSTEAPQRTRPLPTPSRTEPTSMKASTPKPLVAILQAQNQLDQQGFEVKEDQPDSSESLSKKPPIVAKSPELRKVSASTPKPLPVETPTSPIKDRLQAFDIAQDRSLPPVITPAGELITKQKTSTALASASPLAPSTTRLNSSRPSSASGDTQQKPPVPKPTKPIGGLGLNLAASSTKKADLASTVLTPPPEKPLPLSEKKSQPTDGTSETESTADDKRSSSSSTKEYLTSFFDQPPKASDKIDFDTQAVMSSKPASASQKTKTLSMSICEIASNGKREPLAANQEHILFEDSMYLCVHAFQPEKGAKSTEAHLWVGDAVPEAAVEDAQLFCRKVARENGAKLEVLKQGKETANFFQALGGILITRRNKQASLYMLCGRRHLGHVAFDEVDMTADSLCSGFPFIVSAKFGKLFLWKGRGSGADELGCARLIGMDLGLTGEIEEINEDEEPKVFWESFSSFMTRSPFSDLWDLKAKQEAYSCRLYRIEMDRQKATGFWARRGSSAAKESKASVEEIEPFCQGDLSPDHVYVLDAFFEIYVYLGYEATSKTTEYVTAIMLAQEMSMLAPTLQDRPLMPACHLVVGDPPRDFKATFRRWEDERYESSLLVRLEEAIEALD